MLVRSFTVVAACAVPVIVNIAAAAEIERVSVDSQGQAGDGPCYISSISADGRYVAFRSDSTNLVAGDTNGMADVFLRDRQTGETTRISVGANGVESNGISLCPVVSPDGRYVAFGTSATNLVPGDSSAVLDVVVHDRVTSTNIRASLADDGSEPNASCLVPWMSGDSRYVSFESAATNLVANDNNAVQDIFVRDTLSATTRRISESAGGVEADGASFLALISADGRYVVFNSEATNLVPNDTNGVADIFRKDLVTGEVVRVSVSTSGAQSAGTSFSSALGLTSPDARFVVFENDGDDLVVGELAGVKDIYLRDIDAGTTVRVSVDDSGNGADADSDLPSVTLDGTRVFFFSAATNLAPSDTNGVADLFVRDLLNGTTTRVSVDPSGGDADGPSAFAHPTADGRHLVFESDATNLIVGDTNGVRDIFLLSFCHVRFETYGSGLAGAAGIVPLLTGQDGACLPKHHSITIENVVGGAPGALFIGIAEASLPAFGGVVLIDVGLPFVSIPLFISGLPAIPGTGQLTLPGADLSGLEGVKLRLQFLAVDPGAPAGVSMTNGLRLSVE